MNGPRANEGSPFKSNLKLNSTTLPVFADTSVRHVPEVAFPDTRLIAALGWSRPSTLKSAHADSAGVLLFVVNAISRRREPGAGTDVL